MKTVSLAYAIEHGQKTLIGIGDSNRTAVDIIKKSGYGFDLSEHNITLLEIQGHTANLPINFKIETWVVNT